MVIAVRSPRRGVAKKESPLATDSRKLAAVVRQNPDRLRSVIEGVSSSDTCEKYRAVKTLKFLSEDAPEILYPYWNELLGLLDHDSAFIRWDAMRMIANLAHIDHENRMPRALDRLLKPIGGHEMVGAANAIQAAAIIAQVRPELAKRIVPSILDVERAVYKTPECRNVVIGHALTALNGCFEQIGSAQEAVLRFAKGQLKNPRASTRRKAGTFLKRNSALKT